MHLEVVVIPLFVGVIFLVIAGLLAKRKNRSRWRWSGVVGGVYLVAISIAFVDIFVVGTRQTARPTLGGPEATVIALFAWVLALCVLAFLPFLCPKCKQPLTRKQRRARTCPLCGSL